VSSHEQAMRRRAPTGPFREDRGDDRLVGPRSDLQTVGSQAPDHSHDDDFDADLSYLDCILPDIVEDVDSVWRRS